MSFRETDNIRHRIEFFYVEKRLMARRVREELLNEGFDVSTRKIQRAVVRWGIVRTQKESASCIQVDKECKACGSVATMHASQRYCRVCRPTGNDLNLIKVFGITKPEYESLLARQNHLCGICKRQLSELRSNQIHIDHCHTTNVVRGVLCVTCNRSLAALDDQIWFERAKAYVALPGIPARVHLRKHTRIKNGT